MRPNKRLSAWAVPLVAAGVIVAVGGGQGTAAAAPPTVLSAAQPVLRKCHAGPASGPGVASFSVTAPATGLVRVRLSPAAAAAAQADWDVAVFDATSGRLVAASAGLRSYEVADGLVTAGARLRVQACRYAGAAGSVAVSTSFAPVPPPESDRSQLVAVDAPTRADKDRLQRLGLDLTESATATTVDTVLNGTADAERLRAAGFTWRVEIPDLAGHLQEVRRQDAAYAAATPRSGLPSGRTSYRRLADYDFEMKDIAHHYPQLVKAFTLAHRTIDGRDVTGVEIAPNVQYVADGRPVFLQLGLHHAREWPSGEQPMEWIYDMVNGYGHDARTTDLVNKVRTIVVPVVNPDGFSVSREAMPIGDFGLYDFEMKRKNCDPAGSPGDTALCPASMLGTDLGTDLNRNYGGFWGGPGASGNWAGETFRGVGPFSEPETQNIRELISGRQVTNLISSHTYGNLVLRPPNVLATGRPVDAEVATALGAEMASHNGYSNIYGYQLYDTTGTTEDWSYWATGGLAYTFEMGATEFHPTFETGVVDEYLGLAPAAGAGRGGNREAYFSMLASAADSADHATLTGSAPPGWTLRLHKQFRTPTSPVLQPDGTTTPPLLYTDTLDSTYKPQSGRFTWSVNPSTRPYVAGRYGRSPVAPPQATIALANPPGEPAENTGDPDTGPHEEVPFTIQGPPAADNGEVHIKIAWTNPDTDWDLYIVGPDGHVAAESATFGRNFEDAVLVDPVPGQYRMVVVSYDQVDGTPYDDWGSGAVTFGPPAPPVPGTTEAWTLTCERPDGSVATSRPVVIARGERLDVGNLCFDRPKHKR